jgi:hypothetical protein
MDPGSRASRLGRDDGADRATATSTLHGAKRNAGRVLSRVSLRSTLATCSHGIGVRRKRTLLQWRPNPRHPIKLSRGRRVGGLFRFQITHAFGRKRHSTTETDISFHVRCRGHSRHGFSRCNSLLLTRGDIVRRFMLQREASLGSIKTIAYVALPFFLPDTGDSTAVRLSAPGAVRQDVAHQVAYVVLQISDGFLDDVSDRDHAHDLARVQHW